MKVILKLMKQLSTFIILFAYSLSFGAESNEFIHNKSRRLVQLSSSTILHSNSLKSKSVGTSIEVESSFNIVAQNVGADVFVSDSLSLYANYYFAVSLDIDAEVQGFDLGASYYFLKNGPSKEIEFLGSIISTRPALAPYISLGASTRDYQFSSVSLKFQGIEMSLGIDYHLRNKYFIKAELFTQKLSNNNIKDISTNGLSVGFGRVF